jgi:hypothetical protein
VLSLLRADRLRREGRELFPQIVLNESENVNSSLTNTARGRNQMLFIGNGDDHKIRVRITGREKASTGTDSGMSRLDGFVRPRQVVSNDDVDVL